MRSLALLLAMLAVPAGAQTVQDCDWRASAHAVAEPWQANTRTFSNGKTRLVITDTIEPGAGAFHLVVLSPPFGDLGSRQCKVVSYGSSIGFAGIEFDALSADYDPARGLIFEVPVSYFDGASANYFNGWLNLTLNQATGQIDAWLGGAE